MRSRFFVLNILIVLMLVACKEDEPIVKLPAAAAFETEKDTFDEGEPIEFINRSEHAISYLWRFGSNETSTEEHPVYTPHIPSQFQGMRFKVKLMAMGADGMMDSTEAYVQVSKRIFRGITIMEMSDSIKKKIPFEDGKSTELYLLTGFQAEPFEWINEYQTYPSRTIEQDYTLPFEYDHSTTWSNVYMGNRMWFIHLHAFVEGSESVVSVKRIDFNPTYLEWYDVELGYKAFSIGDDEISLSVKFAYFE